MHVCALHMHITITIYYMSICLTRAHRDYWKMMVDILPSNHHTFFTCGREVVHHSHWVFLVFKLAYFAHCHPWCCSWTHFTRAILVQEYHLCKIFCAQHNAVFSTNNATFFWNIYLGSMRCRTVLLLLASMSHCRHCHHCHYRRHTIETRTAKNACHARMRQGQSCHI